MLGITAMPNGITAGFSGNTLLFSEAFLPHSYPLANQITTKDDIVGIASIASGLLVTTKGKPLLVSGTDPSAMAMVEMMRTYLIVISVHLLIWVSMQSIHLPMD